MDIETIGRDELKAKIDRGDEFKLVMTLNAWTFEQAHIPGSINVTSPQDVAEVLSVDDEIVVYCSDEACVASQYAYEALKRAGFENVRRYAGGLSEWSQSGYPLEGRASG